MFYQQYLTVLPEGIFTLALCFLPTFVVCYFLLGLDMPSGLLNLLVIIMILVDTIGFMAMWDISYNAVSLINLVAVMHGTQAPAGPWWVGGLGIWPHSHAWPRPESGQLPCVSSGLPLPLPLSSACPEAHPVSTGGGNVCGVCVPHHPLLRHQHQAHPAGKGQGGHCLHGQCGEWWGVGGLCLPQNPVPA